METIVKHVRLVGRDEGDAMRRVEAFRHALHVRGGEILDVARDAPELGRAVRVAYSIPVAEPGAPWQETPPVPAVRIEA